MYLPALAVGCSHLVLSSTAFVPGPSLLARVATPTYHGRSTTAPSMGGDLRCNGREKGVRRRCRRRPELSRLEASAASSGSRPPPEVRGEERESEEMLSTAVHACIHTSTACLLLAPLVGFSCDWCASLWAWPAIQKVWRRCLAMR